MASLRTGLLAGAMLIGFGGSAAFSAPVELDVAGLKRMTEELSSDAFEGRAPMTASEDKTIRYIADHMAAAGLKPGHNGGWFQEVPLVKVNVDPARADLSFSKGGKPVLTAKYKTDAVVWTKRVVDHVSLKDSELVFVGYGVNAPEKGWNDYAGIDMTGKTAVILVNDPDWQTESLEGPFGGKAMTYYGRWTYKFTEAARQGAAGAIIIHDTKPAAYGWNTVQLSWTGPQIDMDRADGGKDRVAIESWIQKPVAEALLKAAGVDLATLSAAASKPGFKAVPLGITVSGDLHNTIEKAKSHNVVGILPGRVRPNEYVIHTAHWDHLGRCGADKDGDDICNGAMDNASGTAGILTLAKAHAKAGPAERSLLFVAVTAEESGLLGSEYYGANPSYPLAQTVAGINADVLNVFGPTRDVVVVGWGKSELEDYLKAAATAQNRRVDREPDPEAGSYYRSDHFSLAKRGVPMLYASSGDDMVQGGSAAGKAFRDAYTEARYHQQNDEYDPNWNWDGAVQDLTIAYEIGRKIADSDAWPNWREGDEFRAIRDASRAGAAK